MNRLTPDFSDPRKSENNPHKKRSDGQQVDAKMLIGKARRDLAGLVEAAKATELDYNTAIAVLMRVAGVTINLIEICTEAAALAMRDGDAARNVMKQVGSESREALATYKDEINQLKQRVTELEKKKEVG